MWEQEDVSTALTCPADDSRMRSVRAGARLLQIPVLLACEEEEG